MAGIGFGGPLLFVVVGIVLAIKLHAWIPAGICVAFGMFTAWLLRRYGNSGRMG